MAVAFRPMILANRSFLCCLSLAFATSFIHGVSAVSTFGGQGFNRLSDPNVIFEDYNGTTVVYSPVTGQEIPQGPASDGSGTGFSTSAIIWIVFSFVVGAPLLIVGFRGWRATIGAAIGTAVALASWAVFVNTLDNVGISDVALTVIVLVLFAMGFMLGLLEMSRIVGILALGILGGLAIGVRIVLLKNGLLISNPDVYFINWLLIGICGFAGSMLVTWRQSYGILNGCASIGSFLCALGFDLVINQQSGMSCGLRYLFDRNRYHVLNVTTIGYNPPTTTVIIIAVSLAVTPAFAFAQWRAFKRPFGGVKSETYIGSLYEPQELPQDEESATVPQQSMDIPDTPTTEKPPKISLSDNANKD